MLSDYACLYGLRREGFPAKGIDREGGQWFGRLFLDIATVDAAVYLSALEHLIKALRKYDS